MFAGNNVGCIFSKESFSCRFVCIKICNCFLVLRFKCCVCSFGSSIILIRYKDFFKVHSRIYGMDPLCFMNGNKINSPDITVIFITFNENRIQIIINVCFKFIEIIFLDPSKAIMDITHFQDRLHIKVYISERIDDSK